MSPLHTPRRSLHTPRRSLHTPRRSPWTRGLLFAADVACAIFAATSMTAIVLGDTTGLLRPIVLATVTAGAGWSIVGWWDFGEVALTVSLTCCTGLAILLLGSLAEVEVHWWHPDPTLAGLSAAVAVTTILRLELRR